MMKKILAGLLAMLLPAVVFAQSVPASNPTYIPAAISPLATLSAPGTLTFNTQGTGTAYIRVTGTFTGLAANVQAAAERVSPVYTTVAVEPGGGGGGKLKTITVTGFYKVNIAGTAAIRFNLTAISTGSVSVTYSSTPAGVDVTAVPGRRVTYSLAVNGLVPAASATDWLTLSGSATTTIRVNHIECTGTSTAAATDLVNLLLRSTADTSGTSTTPKIVALDQNDPAATAVAKAYTANPTTGTLLGVIRAGYITTVTPTSTAVYAEPLVWNFGPVQDEEPTLRGAAYSIALNGNGTSYAAGTSLNCAIEYTEE